jgi:post-segregation antitoxin (ccd killing protein)
VPTYLIAAATARSKQRRWQREQGKAPAATPCRQEQGQATAQRQEQG